MRIILGSASPRRREILQNLGLKFEVMSADIDETIDVRKNIFDEIMRLSTEKAKVVLHNVNDSDSVIISADTIVLLDNRPLGKPKNEQEAFEMLKSLSGKTHKVVTAITVMTNKKTDTRISVTKVTFKHLTNDRISAYIKTGEPVDKAGAYAIQGKGAVLVDSIEGDFFAVVGLPVNILCEMLDSLSVDIL